jgi:hypothetical protein
MACIKNTFLIILLVISLQAYAQSVQNPATVPSKPGWVFVTQDTNMLVYIKPGIDTPLGKHEMAIWVLCDFKPETLNEVTYNNVESKTLEIINCKKKQEKLIKKIIYNSATEKIGLDTSITYFTHLWVNTIPKKIRKAVIKKACKIY